jgi:hypothetical protein
MAVKESHLSVAQQQGKMYAHKRNCRFCNYKYNTELSESMLPEDYCSIECEITDRYETSAYIEHQKEKPL